MHCHCREKLFLDVVLFLGLQAFKEVWEMACAFPARTRILVPAGYNFLVHPIELGGPCKSKVTLDVSINAIDMLYVCIFLFLVCV